MCSKVRILALDTHIQFYLILISINVESCHSGTYRKVYIRNHWGCAENGILLYHILHQYILQTILINSMSYGMYYEVWMGRLPNICNVIMQFLSAYLSTHPSIYLSNLSFTRIYDQMNVSLKLITQYIMNAHCNWLNLIHIICCEILICHSSAGKATSEQNKKKLLQAKHIVSSSLHNMTSSVNNLVVADNNGNY